MSGTVETIAITDEEMQVIAQDGRCSLCGHLTVLHRGCWRSQCDLCDCDDKDAPPCYSW